MCPAVIPANPDYLNWECRVQDKGDGERKCLEVAHATLEGCPLTAWAAADVSGVVSVSA